MKRSINLFLALIGAYSISAQCPQALEGEGKTSDVTSAVTTYSRDSGGDPLKAAPYIERAIKSEKNALKDKTWRVRGDIYYGLATTLPELCPEALAIATESFVKAKEKDLKKRYLKEHNAGLINVGYSSFNIGLDFYTKGAYDKAANHFTKAGEALVAGEAQADSVYMSAVFNSALSYDSAGDTDKAIENYEKSIEIGYEPKQCYYRIIGALQAADRGDESLEAIQKGKAMFPEEKEFLIQETNYYLKAKNFEKAESNLKLAIEKDPSNAMLHFVLGTALDQLEKGDAAAASYKKAIEVDPNYLDAYHNLGASYVNSSVAMKDRINELDFRKDAAEIAQLEKDSDAALKNALPYLEKALELEPGNSQVMNSLKSIYFAFERMDDYNAMKDKIEAMGK